MKRIALITAPLLGITALTACQSYPSNAVMPRLACDGPVMEAKVVSLEADSVVVVGADGPFNVSYAYIPEQPDVGDILRISPTLIDGQCVQAPAY